MRNNSSMHKKKNMILKFLKQGEDQKNNNNSEKGNWYGDLDLPGKWFEMILFCFEISVFLDAVQWREKTEEVGVINTGHEFKEQKRRRQRQLAVDFWQENILHHYAYYNYINIKCECYNWHVHYFSYGFPLCLVEKLLSNEQ